MTTTSGNINSTKMVVQAFLNMTQDITQGIITQQSIDIDCKKNTIACNKCIETAKKYDMASNDYSMICPACYCTLENVNMKNYVTIDFSAFQQSNSSNTFKQQIKNSLTQQATESGTSLFKSNAASDTLDETSQSMYSSIKEMLNENIIQELSNFQVIGITNPNSSVINVDLDLTIDFLSKIIQESKGSSEILDKYDSVIIQLTTEALQDSISILITWIVTLCTIGIIALFFIFGITIVMDVLELYSET
jgi:Zn finger protein HypA/HybF involved in hydrogenase expression